MQDLTAQNEKLAAELKAAQEKVARAPEAYRAPQVSFSNEEGAEVNLVLDTKDSQYQTFEKVAKDLNLPQETFDKVVSEVVQQQWKDAQAAQADAIKALGPDADKRRDALSSALERHLGQETYKQYHEHINTPGAFLMMEKLVAKLETGAGANLPANSEATAEAIKTDAEIGEMMRDPRYLTNPAYKKQVQAAVQARSRQTMKPIPQRGSNIR